jgi:hypothetical protein
VNDPILIHVSIYIYMRGGGGMLMKKSPERRDGGRARTWEGARERVSKGVGKRAGGCGCGEKARVRE